MSASQLLQKVVVGYVMYNICPNKPCRIANYYKCKCMSLIYHLLHSCGALNLYKSIENRAYKINTTTLK